MLALFEKNSLFGAQVFGNLSFAQFFPNLIDVLQARVIGVGHACLERGSYDKSIQLLDRKDNRNKFQRYLEGFKKANSYRLLRSRVQQDFPEKDFARAQDKINAHQIFEDNLCRIIPFPVDAGEPNSSAGGPRQAKASHKGRTQFNFLLETKEFVNYDKEKLEKFPENVRKQLF